MAVITLSRQLGGHGEEIAARVARVLDLRLIDAEAINQAAAKAGVPQMALAELQHEGERSLADQMLKALRTMPSLRSPASLSTSLSGEAGAALEDRHPLAIPFAGLFSATVPPISASVESYVRMVGLVIRGLAREGNVLIVGRGGQVLLRKHPGALHVQIVAPLHKRIMEVMLRDASNWRSAQSQVRASDRARIDYLRRYHNVDWLDPTLYHLVINTESLPVAAAVDLIVAAQRAVANPPGGDAVDQQKHGS